MKKTILTIVQIVVTVGILLWVFHDHNKRVEMAAAFSHAWQHPGWLFAGFVCYGLVEILAAVRWYFLLLVQDVKLPLWRIGALFMLGIFFNQFMPGGTGGDVLKIYFLLKEIPKKKAAKGLLAVLMDRLIGLLALILISSCIIAVQYHWLKTSQVALRLTWLLLLILISGLSAIVFSFLISGFGLARKLPAKMPMRDMVIDFSEAYNAYAKAWPASLFCIFMSFGIHGASFFVFCCAARALSIPISFGAIMTVMPIILTISAMPISVGGTGVREGLFILLLVPLSHLTAAQQAILRFLGVPMGARLVPLCHLTEPQAVTLSLTGFLMIAAWAVIGGLIYLVYRPSHHAKFREVEREVQQLEHDIAEGAESDEPKEPKKPEESKESDESDDSEDETGPSSP